MSDGGKRLKELELKNKYVFHGSGIKSEILEPRQAHNYPSGSDEGKIPDDKPAVFATPIADIAVFMAIVNKKNSPKGIRAGFIEHNNGRIDFRATKETMEQIQKARGYVYVFNKDKFTPRSSSECISYERVEPIEIIEVTEEDLPKDIEINSF